MSENKTASAAQVAAAAATSGTLQLPARYRWTASDAIKDINLKDKVVVITGAASGIGIETARAIASAGAHVILAVRDINKAQAVIEDIKNTTHNQNIEAMTLDLSSLKSVHAFVEEFKARKLPLNILINNAGIMACPYATTAEGFESQFGTNHVGHFVLTLGLVDILIQSKPSRVVVLSSIANKRGGINWEDINWTKKYDKWLAYAQSKTANVLFAVEFNRRYADQGVTANAVHPGGIATGLQKDLSKEEMVALGWFDSEGKANPLFKSVPEGASTSVWAATSPELEGKGGHYLEDCSISGVSDVRFFGCAPHSLDAEAAKKLWDITEQLLKNAATAPAPAPAPAPAAL